MSSYSLYSTSAVQVYRTGLKQNIRLPGEAAHVVPGHRGQAPDHLEVLRPAEDYADDLTREAGGEARVGDEGGQGGHQAGTLLCPGGLGNAQSPLGADLLGKVAEERKGSVLAVYVPRPPLA